MAKTSSFTNNIVSDGVRAFLGEELANCAARYELRQDYSGDMSTLVVTFYVDIDQLIEKGKSNG